MIVNGLVYLVALMLISSTIVFVEKKSQAKLFEYLPSIVVIYFVVMLFSTFGFWEKTAKTFRLLPLGFYHHFPSPFRSVPKV